MRRWLPELIALPLLPLLVAQGRRTRRITPRLPAAPEPHTGIARWPASAPPLSLLAVGESPVAGVGVDTHEEAITGQLARALSMRLQRPIAWRALGQNGLTVRGALHRLLPQIQAESVDIVLLVFGVNDTTAFHSVARWRRDLSALIVQLQQRCHPRLVLFSGVPPMAHFPALPQPLRWVMGLKSAALDRAARDLALTRPRTLHVPLTAIDRADPALMASDGYHPSARGCAAWAGVLADACAQFLASHPPAAATASRQGKSCR